MYYEKTKKMKKKITFIYVEAIFLYTAVSNEHFPLK